MASYHLFMTTGWADPAGRAGTPGAREPTGQRFSDALCGPDGTGDPAVLMPVLQVYPDALSAPMPDAMVAGPPVDPAAMLAAARRAVPEPTPAQVRMAAQRAAAGGVAQPGRYGRNQAPPAQPRPSRRDAPSAWGRPEPRTAAAPYMQGPRRPGANPAPAGSAPRTHGDIALHTGLSGPTLRTTLSELGNLARSGFPAPRAGMGAAVPTMPAAQAPAPHAPTPPLPRHPQRRRNKGSSIWAVLVFLVVIAFASGIAQQILHALSELFNR